MYNICLFHSFIIEISIFLGISERPNVTKHFFAHVNLSMLAEQIYAPRKGEKSLQLESVIG